MLKAKPAPEEEIYNAFGEKLPAEGFARSPIWSWYVEYNKPWQISGQNLQYNLKFKVNMPPNYLRPMIYIILVDAVVCAALKRVII